MTDLSVEPSPIPGLLVVRLPVHADSRGWFKENWQREKMTAQGLPDFGPVQHNLSFNSSRGVTRGIHTEPWDKFVSVATGRVFAAWVDMREGDSFGTTFFIEMDPSVAVFVPRGVGNSYQALDDATTYTYLVNDHWRPGITYPALDIADPNVDVPWPIPLAEADISEKDLANPRLEDVDRVMPLGALILGGHGQLGRALAAEFPDARVVARDEFDITDPDQVHAWPWHEYSVVMNAAAWTAVDAAETPDGRRGAWATNAVAPARLAQIATQHRITLVHYSTDYVFDGVREIHTETEQFSPLGVYGQTKAAGDLAVATVPRHYILRTSWVIGDGHNFVRTMQRLASNGERPRVVSDQRGRLTFATTLSSATAHLLTVRAPYGTYNVTNSGPVASWADVAREVYQQCNRSRDDIIETATDEYGAGRDLAPRPPSSVLALDELATTGFLAEDWVTELRRYLGPQDG